MLAIAAHTTLTWLDFLIVFVMVLLALLVFHRQIP